MHNYLQIEFYSSTFYSLHGYITLHVGPMIISATKWYSILTKTKAKRVPPYFGWYALGMSASMEVKIGNKSKISLKNIYAD